VSPEDLAVVRALVEAWDHRDIAAVIHDWYANANDPEAVVQATREFAEQDPGWRNLHPEIVWDVAATGGVGAVVRGIDELGAWWRDWAGLWESYVTHLVGVQDLGDWALAPVDVEARGRDGIPLTMRVFQLFQVEDGKVSAARFFLSEAEATEAAR